MAQSLIRFSCKCGKHLAAPSKYVGREARCPRCKTRLTVPAAEPGSGPSSAAPAARTPCAVPKLDQYYGALLKHFGEKVESHEVVDGFPRIRFLLPEQRRQELRLFIERDEKGREHLVISSEIGTATTFEETATALRMNRAPGTGRLIMDETQLLSIEYRARLDELDEATVRHIVEEVARKADEYEATLFGIDVR